MTPRLKQRIRWMLAVMERQNMTDAQRAQRRTSADMYSHVPTREYPDMAGNSLMPFLGHLPRPFPWL